MGWPARAVVAMAFAAAQPAAAGPPFFSDDPVPTDLHRWEVYVFATGAHLPGETDGQAGLDVNFGGFRDVQLTMVLPVDYAAGSHVDTGSGNVELAVKVRVLHQRPGSWLPELAIFPRVFAPTARPRLGSRRLAILLPLWAERDFGRWSVFGGGGYQIRRAAGARSGFVESMAVTRQCGERLSLGTELFHHARDADNGRDYIAANVGATYRLGRRWSLLGSAGPGLEHARAGGRWNGYLALKAGY